MKITTRFGQYWTLHVLLLMGSNTIAQSTYDDSRIVKLRDGLEAAANSHSEKLLLDSRSKFERLLSTEHQTFLIHYYIALADEHLFHYYSDPMQKTRVVNDGIMHLERSIELNDDFAESRILLAGLYGLKIGIDPSLASQLGTKAASNFTKAKKLDPGNPRLYLVKGKSAVYKPEAFGGGSAVAKKELNTALHYFAEYKGQDDTYPHWGHAETYAWLGRISEMEKDVVLAEKHFKSALSVDPNYNWVKMFLLPAAIRAKNKHPNLDPGGAHIKTGQTVQVTITHNTSQIIRYTLDGSEPSESSQSYHSPISVTRSLVIKAKAFYHDHSFSSTGNFKYVFAKPLQPKMATGNLSEGLQYQYFEGEWDSLPDLERSIAVKKGIASEIAIKNHLRQDNFVLNFTGYLSIAEAGTYKFHLRSDDGSKLYVNNRLVIDNDGLHDNLEVRTFMVSLQKGYYPIQVSYFERVSAEKLELLIEGPNLRKQKIPARMLWH